ncbi:MAG TPA: GTP-binding protein [Jiangellales bacterium]|nr:GTP-binding protein [Jiangellales bacterium]
MTDQAGTGQGPAGTLLRLATAGSVDDGKSTLVGRLLHDSKAVLADQLESVERVSRDRGLDRTDLALLTDGLRAEREQGITIDVAYRYFATSRRTFVLADCPGHVQYTRNTVTGASTADVVLVLVDARHGVGEQTRRHLAVAALLRVPHVALAVNKIDLVGYDQSWVAAIAKEVGEIAADLGIPDVRTIPVSALDGDNVVTRSERTAWYEGPTLLDYLESVPLDVDPRHERFRLPVQYVLRHGDYRGYAGQVATGVVRVGDEVLVLPAGHRTTVGGIDTADGPLPEAFAPQSVSLRLGDDLDVARGDLLAHVAGAPEATQDLEATVCWLGDRELRPGARLLLKHGTRTVRAAVREVTSRLGLDPVAESPADSLALNDIGRVTLRLASPVAPDAYERSRRTGSFLLVDDHDGWTLAAGMVGDPLAVARRRCPVEAPASRAADVHTPGP